MAITNENLNAYYHAKVELPTKQVKISVEEVIPLIQRLVDAIHKEDGRFRKDIFYAGSYFQGLKVAKPNEFDFSVPLALEAKRNWFGGQTNPRYYGFQKVQPSTRQGYGAASSVGYVYHDSGLPNNHDSSTETAREDVRIAKSGTPLPRPPVGFIYFSPSSYDSQLWNNLMFEGDIVPFLVRRQLKIVLESVMQKMNFGGKVNLRRKMFSPALTLTIQSANGYEICVDVAPIVRAQFPFDEHIRWPRASARWPSREKTDKIKSIGIDCVAKRDFVWRLCYAEAEKELVKNIDEDGGCRKRCHRIMKKLNNDVWFNVTKPIVSSYTLKNLLFWECEKNPYQSSWVQSKLHERFTSILRCLQDGLRHRNIQHYFNPDVNMLKDKDPEDIGIGLTKIDNFLRDPQKYLKT